MAAATDRRRALEILDGAVCAGARAREVAALLGVRLTTLQRWRRQFADDGDSVVQSKGSCHHVAQHLREQERQRILLTTNEPEFTAAPPEQIMPVLANRRLYKSMGEDYVYGSILSFYRVLHAHG